MFSACGDVVAPGSAMSHLASAGGHCSGTVPEQFLIGCDAVFFVAQSPTAAHMQQCCAQLSLGTTSALPVAARRCADVLMCSSCAGVAGSSCGA
jgi:hypothetical protein